LVIILSPKTNGENTGETTKKCGETTQRVMSHMGVSKNSGAPKWMVYNGKPY